MSDLPDLFKDMTPDTREKFRRFKREMDTTLPEKWRLTPKKKEQFLSAGAVAFDVETLSEAPDDLELEYPMKKFGVTFLSHVTHIGLYAVVDGEQIMGVITAPLAEDDIEFLNDLFRDPEIVKVAHYSVFDTKMICGKYPVDNPAPIHDTIVGNALLRGSYGGDPKYVRRRTGDDDGGGVALDTLVQMYGIDKRWTEFDDSAMDVIEEFAVRTFARETDSEEDVRRFERWQKEAVILPWDEWSADTVNKVAQEFFKYMKSKRSVLHEQPPSWVATYVLCDVWTTYEVYQSQLAVAQEMHDFRGYSAVFDRITADMRTQQIENGWCIRGFWLDIPYMRWMLDFIKVRKLRLLAYFRALGCGDMTKSEQQRRYVFAHCGCTPPKPFETRDGKMWWPAEMQHRLWTKTALDAGRAGNIKKIEKSGDKYWSTGAGALEWYVKEAPQKIGLLQYYNKLLTTERTIHELLGHAQEDGRVHPGLSVTANSGRTNSDKPNMMNIDNKPPRPLYIPEFTGTENDDPREKPLLPDDEDGNVFTVTCRGMVVAPPGYMLMEFDASNAESRFQGVLAAIMAGDLNLATVFANGVDLHTANAKAYWPEEWEKIKETCSCGGETPLCKEHKRLRGNAKIPYFASGYGAGIPKLSSQLMTPMDTVREMMDNYATANPGIQYAKDRLSKEVYDNRLQMEGIEPLAHYSGYVTLWNERRVWVETYSDGDIKAYTTWNILQQGGVGGIVNDAVDRLDLYMVQRREDEERFRSFIYQQLHDAIILAVPVDDPVEAWSVGQYTAMLLMTRLPYDDTVIDGVHVPWPSGCDLAENAYKWNWRWNPDKPSHIVGAPQPYPTTDKDGKPVEITFSEAEAWIIMIKRAKRELTFKRGDMEQEVMKLLTEPPFEKGFTMDFEGDIRRVEWGSVVEDLPLAFEAARRMMNKIEKGQYTGKRKTVAQGFIDHMERIADASEWLSGFEDEMQRYIDVQEYWEGVADAEAAQKA